MAGGVRGWLGGVSSLLWESSELLRVLLSVFDSLSCLMSSDFRTIKHGLFILSPNGFCFVENLKLNVVVHTCSLSPLELGTVEGSRVCGERSRPKKTKKQRKCSGI